MSSPTGSGDRCALCGACLHRDIAIEGASGQAHVWAGHSPCIKDPQDFYSERLHSGGPFLVRRGTYLDGSQSHSSGTGGGPNFLFFLRKSHMC